MSKYTIGSVSENYPEAVQEFVNMTLHTFAEAGLAGEVDMFIFEEGLCKVALQKFLSGGELDWSEAEFIDTLNLSIAQSHIAYLKERGYIDSIEDVNGEEIVWATEKGKEIINNTKPDNVLEEVLRQSEKI